VWMRVTCVPRILSDTSGYSRIQEQGESNVERA
jgi:hypothetical protein